MKPQEVPLCAAVARAQLVVVLCGPPIDKERAAIVVSGQVRHHPDAVVHPLQASPELVLALEPRGNKALEFCRGYHSLVFRVASGSVAVRVRVRIQGYIGIVRTCCWGLCGCN